MNSRIQKVKTIYSHEEYRSAGVAHVFICEREYEFYFKGKLIPNELADEIVKTHLQLKKQK